VAGILSDTEDTGYDMKALAHLIRAVCEFCGEPILSKLEDMFDTSRAARKPEL
jgi:hypothetical protein